MNIKSITSGKLFSLTKNTYKKVELWAESLNMGKRQTYTLCFVVMACFSILLFLNMLTPLISDDFAYLFIYGESGQIQSIGDVVRSQINHYYMWGGRSIVHFIAQILLMIPPYVADILNSLIYVGYVLLIYFHIKGRGSNSISLFVLINLAVWFCQPVFGDTVLWLTGSANYLWGTFFILLFLLPYRIYSGDRLTKWKSALCTFILFILGVIAGWTNENTAGAMIVIVLLLLVYYRFRAWRIPLWSVVGFAGAVVGYAVMILAPGNFERAGESNLSFFILAYRLFNCTLTFFYYCYPIILISLIAAIMYYHFPTGNKKNNLYPAAIYFLAAIAAVYAMLLAPTFPRRALFGVVTYLIIGGGILYYNLNFKHHFLKQIRSAIIVVGLISFFFTFYVAAKDINSYRLMSMERETMIDEAKKRGETVCEFERFDGGRYIHGEDPFSGELMSRYYGIGIRLKAKD